MVIGKWQLCRNMKTINKEHLPGSWTVDEESSEYIRYSSGSEEIFLINASGKEYDIRIESEGDLLFRENGFDDENIATEVIYGVMRTLDSL